MNVSGLAVCGGGHDRSPSRRSAPGAGRGQGVRLPRRLGPRGALSREARSPLLQAHALRHLPDIDREAGHASEALAHAEKAASVYRAKGPPLDLANALRLKALALDDPRRPDQAAAVRVEARDLYAAEGVAAGVAECEARLAPAAGD